GAGGGGGLGVRPRAPAGGGRRRPASPAPPLAGTAPKGREPRYLFTLLAPSDAFQPRRDRASHLVRVVLLHVVPAGAERDDLQVRQARAAPLHDGGGHEPARVDGGQ